MAHIRSLSLLQTEAYIGGSWVKALSGKSFQVKNPANAKVITEVPDMDSADAKNAIDYASNTFKKWQETTSKERSVLLRKWYDLSMEYCEELSNIITAETGKPLAEAKGEVIYGNSFLDWFADTTRHIEGEIIASPFRTKEILFTRQPIGVVSIISPWNFPYAMVTRKIGAILAAGCTCIIKPAEDTPLSALACAKLAEQAGIPPGVINVVTASRNNVDSIGSVLCEDDAVAGISFTGSTHVGKLLYSKAAKGVKRVSLELGGNAPFIVFSSADLDLVVEQGMAAKFRNNGQSCSCANKYLIHEHVYDSFVYGMKVRMSNLKLGDGMHEGVNCGPLINDAQFQRVKGLVDDAVSKGAKVLLGGKPSDVGCNYFEPTLLVNINSDMRIYHEEIFGPVVSVVKFVEEEEAIRIANSTRYGLASYVFTRELGQAFRVSKRLDFGMVGINDSILSHPEAAFGGIKESGIGREGSKYGVEEFTYLKYNLLSALDK